MPETAGDPPVSPTLNSVPDDTLCIRCAYSLRGLSPSGVCPECAMPIAQSLPREGALPLTDWRRIESGLRLVLIANAAGALAVPALWAEIWYGIVTSGIGPVFACIAIFLCATFVRTAGYLRLSSLESPDYRDDPSRGSVGRMAVFRLCTGVLLWGWAGLILAQRADPAGLLLAIILHALSGLLQILGSDDLLGFVARRSRPRLARTPGRYCVAILVISLLGIVILIGPLIAWCLYHRLLYLFWKEARTHVRQGRAAAGDDSGSFQ